MNRLLALLKKEFIQMSRDRITLAMMVMFPIIQLILFGYAINTDVKHLSTVVFDQSFQQEGRDLLAAFEASGYFNIKYIAASFQEVNQKIDQGQAKVGIIIPPDFTPNLKHGRSAAVQVIVDASDSMASSSAISAAQTIGLMKSQELLIRRSVAAGSGAVAATPYDIRIRPWYNPDFISAHYMVPGILGMVLTMTMVMFTSMAIVRERERGTLEQLIVTPLKSAELMFGKIIPYIIVGYVQITLSLLVGVFCFGMPIRGSLGLLYLLTALFIIASLALGMLISNFAQTQMQAMQMSFFIFMPSILLSGFVFPREAMPWIIAQVSNLFPLTFYLLILRGIMLKGIGIGYLWPQVFALLIFIVIVMTISIMKFQKKIG